MNFLLDVLFLAIVVLTVVRCTVRGFVRSIMHLVSLIAAFLSAYYFTPPVALWLEENFFAERIAGQVANAVEGMALRNGEWFNLSRLFADMPADFAALLQRYGADSAALGERFGGLETAGAQSTGELAASIARPVVSGLSNVTAFILLFVAAIFVCSLIGWLLDLIVKLPVLRTANRLLGFVLGVICAALLGVIFVRGAVVVVGYLHSVDPVRFDADAIEQTMVLKYVCGLLGV